MHADARLREIGSAYPSRRPRASVESVERLVEAADVSFPATNVVVVGTNGKTSTATFLARLARGAGLLDGLTTSPHVSRWGERVRIGGEPIADDELADRVGRLHGVAQELRADDLRFFDLVTLAAADAFVAAGVELGVFEAGIGGRLDSTRAVPAHLVVLTGIGLDHVELLGDTEEQILREKLGVARPGTPVVSASLGDRLENVACELADVRFVRSAAPAFLERNAELAVAAARLAGIAAADTAGLLDEPVPGRMHRLVSDGVEVILDAAHNPQAWSGIAPELPSSFVAVVSVSADRDPVALREALAGSVATIATTAWQERSLPAAELARALGAETLVVEEPGAAVAAGRERARDAGVPLVVLGTAYLLTHAYGAL